MTEIEKYKKIYLEKAILGYGNDNCGHHFLIKLLEIGASSVADIGCGHNKFCKKLRDLGINSVGVDFVCPSADIIADAKDLPFLDKKFDWVTCFDTLEHLLPEDVDKVLKEFSRVSNKFAFSICCRPSVYLVDGENLHPTVMPIEWWLEKISIHAKKINRFKKYIYGEW